MLRGILGSSGFFSLLLDGCPPLLTITNRYLVQLCLERRVLDNIHEYFIAIPILLVK
jgi:hypothetical protein